MDTLFQWSQKPISKPEIRQMLEEACQRLGTEHARVEVAFKYFITKRAPSSKSESSLDYDCKFEGVLDNGSYELTMAVEVPVTILCPCSKELSRCGAHNQRAIIGAQIRCEPDAMVWIEDLVNMLERQGSAEIFPLLKREDEKFVTEAAYENPKFVEDVVRDIVGAFRADPKIAWFRVSCESLESIHNHTVYAFHEEGREVSPAGGGARGGATKARS